jgi:hypothetical protein
LYDFKLLNTLLFFPDLYIFTASQPSFISRPSNTLRGKEKMATAALHPPPHTSADGVHKKWLFHVATEAHVGAVVAVVTGGWSLNEQARLVQLYVIIGQV